MTQENKELLLKDLCARLPYHVRLKVWLKDGTTEEGFLDLEHNYGDVLRDAFYYNKIIDIKPYLRPMSSMTEEEMKTYQTLQEIACSYHYEFGDIVDDVLYFDNDGSLDYLNAHHFDFRGLIERGLAIEVTEENNPYKE